MKKQGQIKSVPITEITDGKQVLTPKGIGKFSNYCFSDSKEYVVVNYKNRNHSHHISELKQLIVEYVDGYKIIPGNNSPIGKSCEDILKEIPLKYSQWQAAIDNDEVDSDKVVEFEIINSAKHLVCKCVENFDTLEHKVNVCQWKCVVDRQYAKIISVKNSWDREEVIVYGKLAFDVGRNYQLTGENNLKEIEDTL